MQAALRGPTGYIILTIPKVTLGRAHASTVVLSDLSISLRHAEIHVKGENCWLRDLASLNGTFVNERRLPPGEEYRLQPGDILRLGNTQLTFLLVRTGNSDVSKQETVKLPEVPAPPHLEPAPPTPVPTTLTGRNRVPLQQGDETRTMTTEVPLPPLTVPRPSHQAISPPSSLTPPISPKKTQPQQQRGLGRAFALVGLVFVILAGSLGGLLLVQHNQLLQQQAQTRAQATAMAVRQATARAQATATATVTSPYPPFTHLALFDPLTRPAQSTINWDTNTGCQFTPQGYRVSVAKGSSGTSNSQACLAEGTNFGDFAYQVTMTITQGDCGGLLFRLFHPASQRQSGIIMVCQSGLIIAALRNIPLFTAALRRGENQANTIAVVAQQTTIRLYINSQFVESLIDSSPTQGAIGLLAGVSVTSMASVTYTNALLWTASPS